MQDLAEFAKEAAEHFDIGADAATELDDASDSVFVAGAAILAAVLTRRSMKKYWERRVGSAPPENPAIRDVPWGQALAWGVGVGAMVGLAKVVSRRGMTSVVRRINTR